MPLVVAAPASAAGPKRFATKIKITGINENNVARIAFRGKVRSKRAFCRKGRRVVLRQVEQKLRAGKTRARRNGRWRVVFNGHRIEPGVFRATVKRKVVRKNGKRIVCRPATTVLDASTR